MSRFFDVAAANYYGSSLSIAGDQAYTFASWVKSAGVSDAAIIYSNDTGGFQNKLSWWATGNIRFQSDGPVQSESHIVATSVDVWHHIAMVDSGTSLVCYIDGAVVVNVSGTSNFARGALGNWYIGAALNGEMYDAMVFQGALTANEIAGLYSGRFPVSQLGALRAWWPMYGDNPVVDLSGRGNVLTVRSGSGSTAGSSNSRPVVLSRAVPAAIRIAAGTNTANSSGTTQGTGASAASLTASATSAGSTQATGASAATMTRSQTSTGASQATGSSAQQATFAASSSSTTQSTGASSATSAAAATSAGSTQATGTSVAVLAYAALSSGTTQAAGSSAMTQSSSGGGSVDSAGATQAPGSSVMTLAAAASSSSTTQATGASSAVQGITHTSSGSTQSTGASAAGQTSSAASIGSSQTSGASAQTLTASAASSGSTHATGASSVAIVYQFPTTGLTATFGVSQMQSSAGPAASSRRDTTVVRRLVSLTGRRGGRAR